jgi:hypothetical protein
MWVRRVFYNQTTGDVLRTWSADGNFRMLAQDEEAAICGISGCACLEWREPDADIEAAFLPADAEGNPRIVNVAVDVSGEAPRLVFNYEAVLEPQPSEREDMAAALALLGVEPQEGA